MLEEVSKRIKKFPQADNMDKKKTFHYKTGMY